MKLRKVHIENFRGIKKLELDLRDTTVLIGENNSGKTAVLEALRLCLRELGSRGRLVFDPYDFHLQDAAAERRSLVWTIISFTAGHSLTLALASLGAVHVPQAPIEAAIALSIYFLAVELTSVRQGRRTLTQKAPWAVAAGFGLLHGLGFAGALAEVGLPTAEIPLALFSFNVGIELGQLAFVGTVLLVAAASAGSPSPGRDGPRPCRPTGSARWPLSGSCREPSR